MVAKTSNQLCQANIFFLKYIFWLWPLSDTDKSYKIRGLIAAVPNYFVVCMMSSSMFYDFAQENIPTRDLIEVVAITLTVYMMCCGNVHMSLNIDRMTSLVDKISDFEEFGKPPTTDAVERRTNWLVYGYCGSNYLTVAMYCLLGFYATDECLASNEKYLLNRICGMPLPLWIPTTILNFMTTKMFRLAVYVGTLFTMGVGGTVNTLVAAMVEAILPRIDHLVDMLKHVLDVSDKDEQKKQLYICIRYHQLITSLVDEVNKNCSTLYIGMNMALAGLIAMLLYCLAMIEHSITAALHGTLSTAVLFLICFCGQRLITRSEYLTAEIYKIPWYRGDVSIQKDVMIILMRSQRLMHLSTMGLGDVTFVTFKNAMSNMYSVMTILMQSLSDD